jgi:hypothetical protein
MLPLPYAVYKGGLMRGSVAGILAAIVTLMALVGSGHAQEIGRPKPYREEPAYGPCIHGDHHYRGNNKLKPEKHIVHVKKKYTHQSGVHKATYWIHYAYASEDKYYECDGGRAYHRYYYDDPVHREAIYHQYCRGGGCSGGNWTYGSWKDGHED